MPDRSARRQRGHGQGGGPAAPGDAAPAARCHVVGL